MVKILPLWCTAADVTGTEKRRRKKKNSDVRITRNIAESVTESDVRFV